RVQPRPHGPRPRSRQDSPKVPCPTCRSAACYRNFMTMAVILGERPWPVAVAGAVRGERLTARRPPAPSPKGSFPDLECGQSFGLLGLHDDVRHLGKARTVLCPFQQVLYVLAGPLEDGLHPAVVEVAHPPAHTMQHGHPLARIPEVNALNPARDQHPKTNHSKTLRPVSSRAGGCWPEWGADLL